MQKYQRALGVGGFVSDGAVVAPPTTVRMNPQGSNAPVQSVKLTDMVRLLPVASPITPGVVPPTASVMPSTKFLNAEMQWVTPTTMLTALHAEVDNDPMLSDTTSVTVPGSFAPGEYLVIFSVTVGSTITDNVALTLTLGTEVIHNKIMTVPGPGTASTFGTAKVTVTTQSALVISTTTVGTFYVEDATVTAILI